MTSRQEEQFVPLMLLDPFRALDRLAGETLSTGARALQSVPLEAVRRGDELIVHLDVPGVGPDDIDLTVERNVVSVRVRRVPARQEADELLIDERPHGEFVRQLLVGDNVDADRLTAGTRAGVLTLAIPGGQAGTPGRVVLGSPERPSDAPNLLARPVPVPRPAQVAAVSVTEQAPARSRSTS